MISLPAWASARSMTWVAGMRPIDPQGAVPFVKGRDPFTEGQVRVNEQRDGVPAVGGENGGSGVVARHDERVRVQINKLWDELVHLLQRMDLGVEVAVLTGGVGVLVVQVEEVVLLEAAAQGIDLIAERGACGNDIHPANLG